MEYPRCSRCSAAGERITTMKCPICLKLYCEGCQVNRGGRGFCSAPCADSFFFEEEE